MKLGGWLVMLSVMILFLSLIGLNIPGLNSINEQVGIRVDNSTSQVTSADIENSNIWTILFSNSAITIFGVSFSAGGILIALLAGSVAVGLFAKGYDPSLVLLPIVIFVAGLYASTFWAIISYVKGFSQTWITSIVAIIFSGLGIGFIFSCIDYFGGR